MNRKTRSSRKRKNNVTIDQYAEIAIKVIAISVFVVMLCVMTFGVFGGGGHH